MSRWIEQAEMTGSEIVKCVIQAKAIISLCERASWNDLQNGSEKEIPQVAEDIQFALQLAGDLLVPVQGALEAHEGLMGGRTDG